MAGSVGSAPPPTAPTAPSEQLGAAPGEIYAQLAEAYAASGEPAFSVRMAEFVLEWAGNLHPGMRRVADLACGVGAACLFFAEAGLDVVGVDRSSEMIRIARRCAYSSGAAVTFHVQDYRHYRTDEPVDLVTCMYDSLNFMQTEDDVRSVFRAVHDSLGPGGVFVFDVYTPRGLAECWGTQVEIHTTTSDHFIVTQTTVDYEEQTHTKSLYGFSRTECGHFARWEEHHEARAFPRSLLQGMLQDEGFQVREIMDWDDPRKGPATGTTRRAVFVAVRGG